MILYDKGLGEFKDFLLTENKFDELYLAKTETIMAQGNGYMCTRGYAEEDYPKKTANTFIAGTFNIATHNEVSELPNVADCFSIEILIDGVRFFLTDKSVEDYDKTLNLKTGELIRTFKFNTDDNSFEFKMKRFISSHNLHLGVSQIIVKPLKKDCNIKIISGIDSKVTNSGSMHFSDEVRRFYEMKFIYTCLKTTQSKIDVHINVCHRVYLNEELDETLPTPKMDRREAFQKYNFNLKVNDELKFEKYVTYHTSIDEDNHDLENSYMLLKSEIEKGYDKLFDLSVKSLNEKLWKNDYIKISSINQRDQFSINYAMYHLNVMTPAHSDSMNIGAKGISGEGYKGHTFWDTEVFILPRFILQNPEVAKKLLIYRYKGLAGARKKAKENKFKGAMFPWESANPEDGEVTPLVGGVNVYTGETELIKTGFIEIHITSDVAFGVYSYFNFTNDIQFMKDYGYEILIDTAIFWNSRLETSSDDDLLHITNVIGPDEYKEHVDDNAYTNYLAKWNMEYAVKIVEDLKSNDKALYDKLVVKTGIDKEIDSIKENATKIYIAQPNEEKIIAQDKTFLNLKEICLDKYRVAEEVSSINEDYNMEQLSEIKASKQADVMVLFLLFGEKWNNEIKACNFNYYEPFCLHDSSLSFSTYSVLSSDIQNTEYGYELFHNACAIDIGQNMSSCDKGVHAASYGGIWQCIVYGFAGVRMVGENLVINPNLPKEVDDINFNMYYQGQQINIEVTKNKILIKNDGDKELNIIINENSTIVSGKNTMEVSYV